MRERRPVVGVGREEIDIRSLQTEVSGGTNSVRRTLGTGERNGPVKHVIVDGGDGDVFDGGGGKFSVLLAGDDGLASLESFGELRGGMDGLCQCVWRQPW